MGGIVAAFLGGLAVGGLYWSLVRDLPDFTTLADYRPPLTTVVLDRHGEPIAEFFVERRRMVPLADVPQVVIDAFLAAEDDTFYEHGGVDYRSILRAAWANVRAGGETVQGASTITQQMVKQLLLSPEQTYTRKIREALLAQRIEDRFTKEEILELYLNQIYFGAGAHGIAEAALTYYGKPIGEVTVAEAAMLAGLPKAPGRHSPFLSPERSEDRRRYVLDRMREEGFLDDATWQAARDEPPELATPAFRENFADAAYFSEQVRRRLVDVLGNDQLLGGGLVIETTLDLALQHQATEAVRAGLVAHDHRQGYRGAVRSVGSTDLTDPAGPLAGIAEENGGIDRWPEGHEPPQPLLGVVLRLDEKAGHATVGFAPGLEAQVALDDVTWARPYGDDHRWDKVDSLDDVFAVGDVARFRVQPSDDGTAVARLYQEPLAEGALLSFEIGTGEVLALVGGRDFEQSEFDRTTQARRQPGSAYKPLIYAAAVESEFTPASTVYDRPVVYDDPESGVSWRPENYGRKFLGAITLREALARSVNNAAIHVLQEIGVGRVLDLSRRLGIESRLDRNLGLALGVSPVTLLEITRAYATLAAGGHTVEPIFVRRVLDRDGQVLLEHLPLDEERPSGGATRLAAEEAGKAGEAAMDPATAYLAASLLRDVVEHPRGTGRRARSLGRTLGGKTGTTNDGGDAWFVGFSPDVATGAWVGFDEDHVLGRGETGGRAALPIWIDFMKVALEGRPKRDLVVPDGIVFARIDAATGLLAAPGSEDTVFQAFLAGTAPTARAEARAAAPESERRLRLDF